MTPPFRLLLLLAILLPATPALAGAMRIESVAPTPVRPGETVTLAGAFPETRPAGVRVRYGAGDEPLGETGLPVVWTSAQVTVQLPRDIAPGSYWLALYENDAPVSNRAGGLEVAARSTFPVPTADDDASPGDRLADLPAGIEIPDGQIEALHKLPYIMRFEASVPDCPSEPLPRNFLSYNVTNNVRRVTIDAVYADGRTRRFHEAAPEAPRPALEATALDDPGISPGLVAYRLEATGAKGGVARKELPFRVAERVALTLESPFREVAGQSADAAAGNAAPDAAAGGAGAPGPPPGTRYEADVEVSNAAAIRDLALEGKSESGETVLTLEAALSEGRIVSAPVPAAPVEGAHVKPARFLLHVRAEDPCGTALTFEREGPVAAR